jgi:hypothetical protein
LFRQDVGALLPGAPKDGPLRLKEDIARRATSLELDRLVTAGTVLAALGASPDQLLPAPSLMQVPEAVIPVPQAAEIARFLAASKQPVVVHAPGGIGKSVLQLTTAVTTQFGPKFAVITDITEAETVIGNLVAGYGHADACIGVRSIGWDGDDILDDPVARPKPSTRSSPSLPRPERSSRWS